jgi:hypothetical protein
MKFYLLYSSGQHSFDINNAKGKLIRIKTHKSRGYQEFGQEYHTALYEGKEYTDKAFVEYGGSDDNETIRLGGYDVDLYEIAEIAKEEALDENNILCLVSVEGKDTKWVVLEI